jgi:hypothetical protein
MFFILTIMPIAYWKVMGKSEKGKSEKGKVISESEK